MNRIRRLRHEQNMTQVELAKKLGIGFINKKIISMYERGLTEIDNTALAQMVILFDVSKEYLLGESAYIYDFLSESTTYLSLKTQRKAMAERNKKNNNKENKDEQRKRIQDSISDKFTEYINSHKKTNEDT